MSIFTRKALTLALGAAALSIAASAPASATYDYYRVPGYQVAGYGDGYGYGYGYRNDRAYRHDRYRYNRGVGWNYRGYYTVGRRNPYEHWVSCASEGGTCYVPYNTRFRFGYHQFVTLNTQGTIPCNTRALGDPEPGQRKACAFLAR